MGREERWKPTEEHEPPDPRRRIYFREWIAEPGINALGVSLRRYIELREAGEWNAWADENLRGRYKVNHDTGRPSGDHD